MTKIAVGVEVLFRQIHPDFYKDGIVGSPAFKPTPGDEGKMSADRSTLTTPENAFTYFTEQRKKRSACVCGISTAEFDADNIGCFADPIAAADGILANPAHCLADFAALDEKKWKPVSKKLRNLAVARGICFTPVAPQQALAE